MLNKHQNTVSAVFRAADAAVILASWFAAYWVRFRLLPFELSKGLPSLSTYASLAPVVAVLWMATFSWMRVYESRRLLSRTSEARRLLHSHGVALLVFIAFTYMFEDYRYSRLVMLYFGGIAAISTVLFRLCLRTGLRVLRAHGRNLRHVLAVGEGHTLEAIMLRLQHFPELGLRVNGVLTETGQGPSIGTPVLGAFGDLTTVLKQNRVQELLIALPRSQQHHLDPILQAVEDETIDIRVVPDVDRYVTLRFEVENFDGLPILSLNGSPHTGFEAVAKRMTDIVLAAVALIVLAPLLLAIGVLVKLGSRGPMLYAQERMGLDGETFKMLKFRSMRVDAEATSGAVWARKNDDRRTAFGTFMRRTSLDELPQFWNVLCGDMSLVGPRPERPVFVQKFRSQIPHYMLRHRVKSGITGWAQVNGWRGDTSLDRRIECDLFYIRNWSYVLDLKILVMTLWKGFVHKNAY